MPDLFHKDYSDIYELVEELTIQVDYDVTNYEAKGYFFKPSYTAGWNMKSNFEKTTKFGNRKIKTFKSFDNKTTH